MQETSAAEVTLDAVRGVHVSKEAGNSLFILDQKMRYTLGMSRTSEGRDSTRLE